jgi:hypothetical protein
LINKATSSFARAQSRAAAPAREPPKVHKSTK